MKIKLYNGNDFFYDHPILTFIFSSVVMILSIIGLIMIIHNCSLDTINHQKEREIQETEEKARICKETGYCNSKNIDINYDSQSEKIETKSITNND